MSRYKKPFDWFKFGLVVIAIVAILSTIAVGVILAHFVGKAW